MGGQYGVEQLKKGAGILAVLLNGVSRILHKQFGSVFDLALNLFELKSFDLERFKKELGELDEAERKQVEAEFVAKLDLVDKVVEAKVKASVTALDETVLLVQNGLALYGNVLALVSKVKTILGV